MGHISHDEPLIFTSKMKWLYIYIHTCPGGGDLKDARYLFTSDYSLIIPHHMMKYISMEWS